ncbi:MAG: Holliday junction branch migration protein RuvA [Polyangiales bacterium]
MIGRLHGRVVAEAPDGLVVVDVQGVGYEVLVPLGTLGRCPTDEEGRVTLSVVTHVREDAITLFGFAGEADRAAFRLLNNVAGVGPRIAVAILGALPPNELLGAVLRGDVKALQAVPGVGKRIAERLALELKDKITTLPAGAPGSSPNGAPRFIPAASPVSAPQGPTGALVSTLVNMGFKPLDAERAAAELASRAGEPLQDLVRDALKRLVK